MCMVLLERLLDQQKKKCCLDQRKEKGEGGFLIKLENYKLLLPHQHSNFLRCRKNDTCAGFLKIKPLDALPM